MNKQNFEILVRATQEMAHPERFAMHTYIHNAFERQERHIPAEWCGTPACLLGNLATRNDLQQLLKVDDGCLAWVELECDDDKLGWIRYSDPRICKHFDITEDEAAALFGPEGCGGAKTRDEALAFVAGFMFSAEGTTAAERNTDI